MMRKAEFYERVCHYFRAKGFQVRSGRHEEEEQLKNPLEDSNAEEQKEEPE